MYTINKKVRNLRLDTRRWLRSTRNRNKLTKIAMGVAIAILFLGLTFSLDHSSELNYQRKIDHQNFIKTRTTLQKRLEATQKQKVDTEAQLKQKAASEATLKAQIDELNKQLQAKAEAKKQSLANRVINTVTGTQMAYAAPVSSGVVSGCGDNSYANFIYMHESGCRLNATNAGGCVGIGQACPGSKLYAVCPDLNYACQNAFFTAYSAKYGGWAGAYAFWIAHNWW